MVYFKENYNFSRFQRGSPTFSRAGGGGVVQLFPVGVQMNFLFSRKGPGPLYPCRYVHGIGPFCFFHKIYCGAGVRGNNLRHSVGVVNT